MVKEEPWTSTSAINMHSEMHIPPEICLLHKHGHIYKTNTQAHTPGCYVIVL